MDGQILENIRGQLLARMTKSESIVNENVEAIVEEDSHPSAEIIDMAQALEQLGRDNSMKEVERRELLMIEKALGKMADGSFGICEDCSEEIPEKRLMVLPEARLCAQCQAQQERNSARYRVNRAVA